MGHMRNHRREVRPQRVRRQVVHTVTVLPDGVTPTGRIIGFSTLAPATPTTSPIQETATPTLIRPQTQQTSVSESELDVDTATPSTTLRTSKTSSSLSSTATNSDDETSSTTLSGTASSSSSSSESLPSATGIGADSSTSSGGLSSGATIGIVVAGVLLAAILLILGFFLFRRKKRARAYSKTEDEKSGLSGAGGPPGRRRPISDASIHSTSSSFVSAPPAPTVFTTSVEDVRQNEKPPASPPQGMAALPVGAGSIERKNIPKRLSTLGIDAQKPVGTLAPIPASPSPSTYTEYSTSPATPTAPVTPNAPVGLSGPGVVVAAPVHRVQIDYTPNMNDELALRTGQLVRIIHEYDDGWALCIRLDRAEQGVCPRTCLSQRPLKPRNRNGPPIAAPSSPRIPNGLPSSPKAGRFPEQPVEQPVSPSRTSFSRPTTPVTYPGKREYRPSPPTTPTTPTITISPFDDSAEASSEPSVPSVLRAGNGATKPSPLSQTTTEKAGEGGQLEKEFYHAM